MNVLTQDSQRCLRTKNLAGLLLTFLALAVVQANAYFKSRGTYVDDFHTIYVWIMAVLVLMIVKRIKIEKVIVQKIICTMGSCAFGVYLIEDVARNQVQCIVPSIVPFFGRFWTSIIFTLLSVLVSMLVIYFVKKIPLAKRLI